VGNHASIVATMAAQRRALLDLYVPSRDPREG
jgi:hypothetical protein